MAGCYYLAGDITNAYDIQTAEKVVRRMMAVMTGDTKYPLLFAVCDDVISCEASFKKTFLLHVQQEPEVTPEGFVMISNTKRGNNGRLVVQSCLDQTNISLVPDYQVNGKEYPLCRDYPENGVSEAGWGRVEISPRQQSRANRMVTVMYAMDADDVEAPIRAETVENDILVGVVLLNRVMIFCKDETPVNEALSFTFNGEGVYSCYIAGTAAGVWKITRNGADIGNAEVSGDSRLITFSAESGEITLNKML